MKRRTYHRRHVLAGLGAAGGLGLLGPGPLAWCGPASRRREPGERVLVLLQLAGGNDGLSTVVPYGDDAYYGARPVTAHPAEGVLRLDPYRGFNPHLKGLHRRFQDGGLAVVQGVGYPKPNRSHFKSFEIWHTADPRGRSSGEGWIGRLCEAAYGDEADPQRVIHIGTGLPYSLYSTKHPASSFRVPEGYRWVANEDGVQGYGERTADEETNPALAHLRSVLHDAQASSAAVRRAAAAYVPRVDYGNDTFALDLRAAAAMIHGGLGARVLSLELSGFDTHNNQRGAHDTLMERLDRGVSAFLADLEAGGVADEVLLVVFSEFGRRVSENASRGTDHGAAGTLFVAGGGVRGGLYGEHPSLTELDNGDLIHSTDFRSVYRSAIEHCFPGVDAPAVLRSDLPALKFV